MGKKCKCPPEGAPEWVVTYGDMMSLLLTFFILLVSLSEIKEPEKYRQIVQEIQKALGARGGVGIAPTLEDPTHSLIKRLDTLNLQQANRDHTSHADDPGIEGRNVLITRVREGMKFVVGGRITFEPGSADLNDEAKRGLRSIAELVRGANNIIELRGHAASSEASLVSDKPDLWELSYARARVVHDYLVSDAIGIRSERIRLIANADREPLRKRAWNVWANEPNRRVEVLVSEAVVKDFLQPEMD